MAKRPVFIPNPESTPFVKEKVLEFEWHSGFAKSQAQKSISSLHDAALQSGITPVLEISSKSAEELGTLLSAFNLKMTRDGVALSVECAYQGSKFFSHGGPFPDLYSVSSKEAKTDERLRNSGSFAGYIFFNESFPSTPFTAFYDWLYLTALVQNQNLSGQLLRYQGFSDIAFNPKKSLNCQARAAALFVALYQRGELQRVVEDKSYYLDMINGQHCMSKSPIKLIMENTECHREVVQLELLM